MNPRRGIAQTLETSSSPEALFVSPTHLDFSIAFFGRRDVLTLGPIDRNAGGDQRQVESMVSQHVRAHRAVGGPVYVYGLEGLEQAEARRFVGGGVPLCWGRSKPTTSSW